MLTTLLFSDNQADSIGRSRFIALMLANLFVFPDLATAVEPVEATKTIDGTVSGATAQSKSANTGKKPSVSPQPGPAKAKTTPTNTPPEATGTTTLNKVKVTGTAEYDQEDPYNPNYVLPKSSIGTKTDTPIMETPLNVQVVSKQVLKDQQVITLDQALQNVSGVTMLAHNNNFGINYLTPVIRGFASQTFFRNGFRLQSNSASRQFANVESVEVLKGPAAILYGQVEPGGMINVVTKKPQETPYYSLNQQFGSYDMYRTSLDATGPLSKNKDLLYRINYSYQNSNSFRDLVYTDDIFVSPSLKWIISPKTQIGLEMEYDRNNNGWDAGYVPLHNGKIMWNVPLRYNWGEPSPIKQRTYFGNFNITHQFNDDWSLKHQFSANQVSTNAELYFPNPFQGQDAGNNKINSRRIIADSQNYTYSTNLDLTGHFNTFWLRHTLLFGGDYYRLFGSFSGGVSSHQTSPGVNFFNPVHGSFVVPPLRAYDLGSSKQKTDQYGLYLQDQVKLPYDIHIMGGVRFQYLRQLLVTGTNTAFTNDALTPRAGLLWQPKPWLSLYSNYVESFGANTVGLVYVNTTTSTPIPATGAKQYEVGAKTEFFGGRLRATLAYYTLTKTNIAIGDPNRDHICGGGGCFLLIGAARSQGPELDIQGEILPNWNAILTFAHTRATIVGGNSPSVSLGAGSQFPGVPVNTASFFSTYKFQSALLKGFSFGGGMNYSGVQHVCCTTQETHKLPGYEVVNLMAGYSRDVGDAKVTVQLNVTNLLNQRYFTGFTIDHATTTTYGHYSDAYGNYGSPRMFMGSISIQY